MAIFDQVQSVVADQLGVDADAVTPDASFVHDLGADSLDSLSLAIALEEQFDVDISADAIAAMPRVRDVITYIEARLAPLTPKGQQ